MDKTVLILLNILISGTGVIGAFFIKYNPPDLNATYLDSNPFAIKKSYIDKTIKHAFLIIAISGLLVQLYQVFSPEVPNRRYDIYCYFLFFLFGGVVMLFFGIVIKQLSLMLARKSWLPDLRERLREMFESSLFIIENNGWRPDQVQIKDQLQKPEKYRQANFESADKRIIILQKIFEVKNLPEDRLGKIEIFKKFFQNLN